MVNELICLYQLVCLFLQNNLVFPNGVTICSKLAKQLEVVNSESSSDRLYINTAFFVLFPEKYIKRQVKKGFSREETLKNFRDSARYDTMKSEVFFRHFQFFDFCQYFQVQLN